MTENDSESLPFELREQESEFVANGAVPLPGLLLVEVLNFDASRARLSEIFLRRAAGSDQNRNTILNR